MRTRYVVWTALLALVLALGACSLEVQAPQAEQLGETATNVDAATFVATEYAYDGPESIPAGVTQVTIENAGEQPHSLWLVKLNDGKTVDDLMGVFAAMESDPSIPEWLGFYGGTGAGPGETSSYWIDLPAGNYAMFSFDMDEEGVPDFAKGMLGELTVTEAAEDASIAQVPEADATVELVDFSFVISPKLGSGPQIVEVINTGVEPHEMAVMRLAEGVTADEAMAAMMAGEASDEEMPLEEAAILAPIASGLTATYELNLEPGEYLLLCFLPSPANEGAPHIALGMVQPISIE